MEILAPAGNMEALNAAINAEADAVYVGLKRFSARQRANNFEDLSSVIAKCHTSNVKVYVAFNTLVYDCEIAEVIDTILLAKEADALIVQDLAVFELARQYASNVPLHASTQMTIMSEYGLQMANELGFKRVVLPRELSRAEIFTLGKIASVIGIELEVFVYGALCVSVSGQCNMSAYFVGRDELRSANRGNCASPCRLGWTCGNNCQEILSLKDQSLIKYIHELEDAGVTSLKIEGRLKSAEYVSKAVKAVKNAFIDGNDFTNGYYTNNFNNMVIQSENRYMNTKNRQINNEVRNGSKKKSGNFNKRR